MFSQYIAHAINLNPAQNRRICFNLNNLMNVSKIIKKKIFFQLLLALNNSMAAEKNVFIKAVGCLIILHTK